MDDLFTSPLAGYTSPYDFDRIEGMEDVEAEDANQSYYLLPMAESVFPEQTPDNAAYPPAPLKATDSSSSATADSLAPHWSECPEDSSSSGSSNQHDRKDSSGSSSLGYPTMDDTPIAHGMVMGADPVTVVKTTEEEASNKLMESAFDFDSASSSPTGTSNQKVSHEDSHSNMTKIPLRSIPIVEPANSRTSRSSESSGSPEAPLSMRFKQQSSFAGSSVRRVQRQPDNACAPRDLIIPAATPRDTRFPHSGPWSGQNVPAVAPLPNYHMSRMAMPYASPVMPPKTPRLYVSNFVAKTRVETQHMLKYTLDPLPSGVTKLHLQPYTMSKPKMMAKPTPARSPDMLELYATVVCSSAMEDPIKREKAFARARGPLEDQEVHRASPREDTSEDTREDAGSKKTNSEEPELLAGTEEEDESRPLNGGPVRICNGCIERERRRAERKKIINDQEHNDWKRIEAQRTVVFNISEVREWQHPSPLKAAPGKGKPTPMPYYDGEPSFSPDAMQVDIPTRISCYCRHQEEKIGFRIIFTIMDYKDNVVAQTMSNSIMITDDHKAHGAPNSLPPSQMSQQVPVGNFPGPGDFQQAHGNYHPAAPLARNAFSATDLPRMNQQFDPRMSTPIGQFAMPQGSSETTSATLTPRNLSRPASPTMLSGQQLKRRKPSGSHRIRSELMMTQYPTAPFTSPTSATPVAPSGLRQPIYGGNTGFNPNYAEPAGISMPQAHLRYTSTNPPTPTTATSTFSPNMPWAQRSQSMENLPQNMMSAASSALPSRVPSPRMTGGLHHPGHLGQPNEVQPVDGYGQMNGLMQHEHAQQLTNSLHSVNEMPMPQQTPVILKLTPAEGPTAGGTEVTCLGTGFFQGIEVMFGGCRATTTTYWSEGALVCLVPPALQAGTVPVTFKHHYDQYEGLPQERQKYFRYVEADQLELMTSMLNLMSQNGQHRNYLDGIRNLAQQEIANRRSAIASNNGLSQGTSNQQQVVSSSFSFATVPDAEMEEILIKCLEQMDLDEGPTRANLNFRGLNGQAPLHLAASLGCYRVAAGLLARGAHADIRDNNGMSPMHMASLRGNVRIIRKLRSAGADPTLRSLNGFTPADMTTTQYTLDAINALDHHTRSRSAIATPILGISRAASVLSRPSSVSDYEFTRLSHGRSTKMEDVELYRSHPVTPAQIRARSRRNSFKTEEQDSSDITQEGLDPNASQLATQSALTAWRDQLSVQIQQFQQTVHRALPPLPNLPGYQDYPVVRRISSLVPQRNTPLASNPDNRPSPTTKETDYRWWELLTGATSAPPAYEDIYPDQNQSQQSFTRDNDNDDKKTPLMRAAAEALMDQKCESLFDQHVAAGSSSSAATAAATSPAVGAGVMETVSIGSKGLTQEQQDRLRSAHAKKIKRLRSDRNLFFIWIPLLILVVLAMVKDRAPLVFTAAYRMCGFVYERLSGGGGRIVEEVR